MTLPRQTRLIRFGVFELDPGSGELRKQGVKIRLEGQPVQVLMCLLETPGEVVSREELHRKLWPADTFVNFENSLNAAVKRLRQALSESASNPRFIETLPRRGYRFIAPVQAVGGEVEVPVAAVESPVPVLPPAPPDPRRPWWLYGVVAAVVLAGLGAFFLVSVGGSPRIRSLAVLPLQNLSGDAAQDFFSDGMTDEVITELGQIHQLRVISRTSAMTYKGTRKSLPQIARELNVDAVVEGAISRSGSHVRITAQLIEAATDKHLWARSYEGELGDSLALQKQVSRAIAAEIRVELSSGERESLNHGARLSPPDYEAYLRGRYYWHQRTGNDLAAAIGYFERVIATNPNYAEAYAGLADSYALRGEFSKAEAAARQAIELDSGLGEAHITLAFCLDAFDWNWEEARREFVRGIALNPGYSTGHQWYAWHLQAVGQMEEAVAEMRQTETLDPFSARVSAALAETLLIAGRYDEAVEQSRKTMNLDPGFDAAHDVLGQVLARKARYGEAIDELRKAGGSAMYRAHLACVYAAAGRKSEAVQIRDELKAGGQANALEIAIAEAGLGARDEALVWLEKAHVSRFHPRFLREPAFDPFRTTARFQNLLKL